MRDLIFTVDLDRDVNLPRGGEFEAGSIDRGSGDSPRFSSADRGLSVLLDLLDDMGVTATFFVEGRTSEVVDCSRISGHCIGFHGYDHEDLTGASTGLRPTDGQLEGILRTGFEAVSDNVSRPVCFRAPYMSVDGRVLDAVSSLGIVHDSSFYAGPEVGAYPLPNGMVEHPVPKGADRGGRTIAAYLWPLHEGRRVPQDYIDLAMSSDADEFVLATHTWHMVEGRDTGPMGRSEIESNADSVRRVLEGILDGGFRATALVR